MDLKKVLLGSRNCFQALKIFFIVLNLSHLLHKLDLLVADRVLSSSRELQSTLFGSETIDSVMAKDWALK